MLSLLLDENISPEIVAQIAIKRPDILVAGVHIWREGRFKAQPDDVLLAAAAEEGLTLVTYDQKTILPVLVRWGQIGTGHGGVIFIDNLTIAQNNYVALIRSLVALWDGACEEMWTDAVRYLRPDA